MTESSEIGNDVFPKYEKSLNESIFRYTKSLRKLGQLCFDGQFEEGAKYMDYVLGKSNIAIVYDDEVYEQRKASKLGFTEWDSNNNSGVIFYPERIREQSPFKRTINNVHKYKSMILKKNDLRTEMAIRDILVTDLTLLDLCEEGGADKHELEGIRKQISTRLHVNSN